MALTPEEQKELEELQHNMNVRPAFAAQSGAAIDQPASPGSEEGLGGIKAAYDSNWTPYGRDGQPIAQTPEDRARDDAAIEQDAARVASMLDPRFSLIPQVLALQTATNDPEGDEAAKAKFEAGQRDIIPIYEPPVDVVRKHLLENPALMRVISPDRVPTTAEIANLNKDSPLYQDTANYMYSKAEEAASKSGQKIARYKDAPWLTIDPAKFKAKAGMADAEGANMLQAFVLGADNTGAFGAMRANQEFAEPTTRMTQARLGINESAPQSSREVNAWTEEEYPLSYGAGQVVGMLNPRSLSNKLLEGIQESAEWLTKGLAATRPGRWLDDALAPGAKSVLGVGRDAAVGGATAGVAQAGQEVTGAVGRGEMPDLREASERAVDVGETGAYLGGAGSLIRRGSKFGADSVRDSPRYSDEHGRPLVRRTEPNLDWRPHTAITGPKLSKQTKKLMKQASRDENGALPGDVLAEEIAGPVGKAAKANELVSADRAKAVRAAYRRSAEGAEQVPMQQLQEEALEKVRNHYQPQPGGGLRAINDKPPPAQKVLNTVVEDVSFTPVKGASKLDPDEAANFLGTRARYQLIKQEVEAARNNAAAPKDPIQRDEFLQTVDARKRAAVEEELDAAIDDVIGDVTPTPARRAKVEQEVLREFVDEASFREVNGSLGDYLRQRGVDAVYVTPRKLDARRTDEMAELLSKDDDLTKAVVRDRGQFSAGGKKGGYNELLKQQDAEAARHADIAEQVAPGGKAFQPIAGLYTARPGEKALVDMVRPLADQSGVREQLDRFRGMQSTMAVHNRARARGPDGKPRAGGYFNPTNLVDIAPLRAFPVLKALEGPLGPLRGGSAGRFAIPTGDETNAAQARAESGARGRYEAQRDRRLKEIEDARAKRARDDDAARAQTKRTRTK